jgi:hypothetical protein
VISKNFVIPAFAAGMIVASASAAAAAQVYDLDISYFNGDSFTGTVSLSPTTSSDTVNGTFDYFIGHGLHKTAESETIDKITTFGPILGGYNSTLTGPVHGQFPSFSYFFDAGVPTPTKPIVEFLGDGVTSISLSAAAPEPGEWALMLLGVLGVGAALRKRRSTVSAAAFG